jgi:hypothetical protein
MHYIVNVSGGLTSYEALRRTLAQHGKDNVTAIFADTLIEDEDLYRFLADQEQHFGITIQRLADGRTPFQVWHDERAITIGTFAPCSSVLKRELCEAWIKANFAENSCIRVFGYSWDEFDRMERLEAALAPVPVWFPLSEPPYVDKCHLATDLERVGIKPPRLYELGFTHNNCGGGCVKAGQAHWAHLWRTIPERYARWEAEEQRLITYLGKTVTILKDRRGGTVKTLTLQAFRESLERGEKFDRLDWGGCGCFAPEPQTRMDDLLLTSPVKKRSQM